MHSGIPSIKESVANLVRSNLKYERLRGDFEAALPTPALLYGEGPLRAGLLTDAGNEVMRMAAQKLVRGKEPEQALREARDDVAIKFAQVASLHRQRPDVDIDKGREILRGFAAIFDRTELNLQAA